MLRADLGAPPKQRYTAQRNFDRPAEGHGADDISYSVVRLDVKDRRKEVRRQAGVGPGTMFVPQTHLPGAQAEVDFGDVHVMLADETTRVYLFSMRLSYSGKAVHRVEVFETGRWFTPWVNRFGQVIVRCNSYSVPVRFIGRQLRGLLHAKGLFVYDGRTVVAHHERLSGRGESRPVLDHYLETLLRKPGAFPGATALEQARVAGKFTPVHEAWWTAARAAHGEAAGTGALIEVLLLAECDDRARRRSERRIKTASWTTGALGCCFRF